MIVPATQKIYMQAMAEGLIEQFIEAGAAVSTPTCGACFGGHNGALDDGEVAFATINRNFKGAAAMRAPRSTWGIPTSRRRPRWPARSSTRPAFEGEVP